MSDWRIIEGDCRDVLTTLSPASVQCCVTSPPYWNLRDYGVDGQIGLEATVQEYVGVMVSVFREVHRVLRDDGTCWVNLGDAYAGGGKGGGGSYESERPGWELTPGKRMERGTGRWGGWDTRVPFLKAKDLIGLPWRVAFALQEDGWWLRSDIVWHKPNPMPESVTDRPTRSHEFIFLLTKSARYFYDAEAIAEPCEPPKSAGANSHANVDYVPRTTLKQDAIAKQTYVGFNDRWKHSDVHTRNKRDVWTVATHPYAEAHFATFPPDLIVPCVLAGCPAGGTVLDPFAGAGTTGLVAARHDRNFIGIELSSQYAAMARKRIAGDAPLLQGTEAAG
jgi:DNA modification methylase